MNQRLLTDKAIRDDLYVEMMITAGSMAFYGIRGEIARGIIERQLDTLVPVVKKHIKRHKRALKESHRADAND